MQLHPEIVIICMLPVVDILLAVVLFTECLWSNLEIDHFKNLVVIFRRVSLNSLTQLRNHSVEYPQKIETLQILQILYQVRRCLDPEIWCISMIGNILILFICYIFWVSFLQGNMVPQYCFRILFSSASHGFEITELSCYLHTPNFALELCLADCLQKWRTEAPDGEGTLAGRSANTLTCAGLWLCCSSHSTPIHLWESLVRSLTLGTAHSIKMTAHQFCTAQQ